MADWPWTTSVELLVSCVVDLWNGTSVLVSITLDGAVLLRYAHAKYKRMIIKMHVTHIVWDPAVIFYTLYTFGCSVLEFSVWFRLRDEGKKIDFF